MNAAGFAKLCGISKPMVSKYTADGLVIVHDRVVDVEASLAMLEGRLNEEKRQSAIEAWSQISGTALTVERRPVARPVSKPEVISAKAQKDEVDLALKRLEYATKARQVISVEEVDRRATEAVSVFREAISNTKRDAAKAFCAKFDLPPEYETPVMKMLHEFSEKALGRFAAACAAMAVPDGQEVEIRATPTVSERDQGQLTL